MKCCIKCRNFIYLLFLSTKLFKLEIQKYAQILCAHKPYFLMPGHIYAHISYHFSWGLIDTNKKNLPTVAVNRKLQKIMHGLSLLVL